MDGISLKLINPDTTEAIQLLPNVAAQIKFKELIKIFENKFEMQTSSQIN
jgi:hypothetical protein